MLLSVAGLLVSAYLTVEHYSSSTTLACPETGVVNCVKVTTSSYSTLVGVPVALLGLLFFAAMTVLCTPAVWRLTYLWVDRVRLAGSDAGVVMVANLVWVDRFHIARVPGVQSRNAPRTRGPTTGRRRCRRTAAGRGQTGSPREQDKERRRR